jgi:hypothetical protein
MKWLICLVMVFPLLGHAESIYLCRAYGGGNFWAKTHCNQHNALIERIASVPAGLPFDLQVNIGEQQRRDAQSLQNGNGNSSSYTTSTTTVTRSNGSECKALEARIVQLDAMARQPQSGQMQDWITGEKRKTRDRERSLGC